MPILRGLVAEALTDRLMKRNTENDETIRKRLERVSMEMEQAGAFDFCVINDDLESAVRQVDEIITSALEPSS